jgi:hypothetical protein
LRSEFFLLTDVIDQIGETWKQDESHRAGGKKKSERFARLLARGGEANLDHLVAGDAFDPPTDVDLQ